VGKSGCRPGVGDSGCGPWMGNSGCRCQTQKHRVVSCGRWVKKRSHRPHPSRVYERGSDPGRTTVARDPKWTGVAGDPECTSVAVDRDWTRVAANPG